MIKSFLLRVTGPRMLCCLASASIPAWNPLFAVTKVWRILAMRKSLHGFRMVESLTPWDTCCWCLKVLVLLASHLHHQKLISSIFSSSKVRNAETMHWYKQLHVLNLSIALHMLFLPGSIGWVESDHVLFDRLLRVGCIPAYVFYGCTWVVSINSFSWTRLLVSFVVCHERDY